ncbi:glutathione-s-transferase omega, putative [Ricinus communis]|uniref:Glutathione-s-transferase omega, putative n=1 Tax=Ricinus communis TaxID=3988 RepID=B9SGT6_RICCO|nr:glutathione-s-transferase omega, putative [Ricinus communis]
MHALSIKSQALSMATDSLYRNAHEVLPPSLNSTSPRPPLSDGTTRLYISYRSPFAQRAWITRNYKGLQDQIELVAIDLENKPVWYREVYSEEKVPALEHNSKVIVESLNIIKYIDNHFEGPSLFPDDTARREFGEEMISYSETFNEMVYNSFKGVTVREADPAFDVLEASFKKFDDGPFLLGQFSMRHAL